MKTRGRVATRRDRLSLSEEGALRFARDSGFPVPGLIFIAHRDRPVYRSGMLREPEFFGDQELVLIYVAKRFREARAVEAALNEGNVDYTVSPEHYTGGVFFTSRRVGAFFYVSPASEPQARTWLMTHGFLPTDRRESS